MNVRAFTDAVLRQLAADPDFTPFVPRQAHTFILDAVLPDIHILPNAVIHTTVIYYRQLATIGLFVEDLRSDLFAQLAPERKRIMYSDYADLLLHADILGDLAEDAMLIALNMTDEGSSGRRSAGAPGAASARDEASKSNP